MRVIGTAERRARLAARHRLLPRLRSDELPAVVDDLPVAHDRERPEHLQLHAGSMAGQAVTATPFQKATRSLICAASGLGSG